MPTAAVNGINLYYEDSRSGGADPESSGATPLLFHHGYTSSHVGWEGVVERLGDRYRCITFDARGTGESARPETGYTIENYAADALALADDLGIARFTFIGHSMGGGVGYHLGVHHPDRLDKLVLMAPVPADGGRISDEDRERRLAPWYAKDRERIIAERTASSPRPPSYADAARRADQVLCTSEGHMTESLSAMSALRLGEQLGEITTPTLMIAAAADVLLRYNLRDFGRLGNATLHVFSRVGHGITSEVPSALARVLPDFLEHGVVTAETLLVKAQAMQVESAD
jgi:pimeloyl-ACP methyl ester carboxylesterase